MRSGSRVLLLVVAAAACARAEPPAGEIGTVAVQDPAPYRVTMLAEDAAGEQLWLDLRFE